MGVFLRLQGVLEILYMCRICGKISFAFEVKNVRLYVLSFVVGLTIVDLIELSSRIEVFCGINRS